MKIKFSIILLLSLINIEQEKEPKYKIVAKYVVFDSKSNSFYKLCDGEIKEFSKMSDLDCSFILDKKEFHILEKFLLNQNGRLQEYRSYKPMGPLIYELKDLREDPKFSDMIGAEEVSITSSSNHIFDSGSTLKIEKIYLKEKLILVERESTLKNRRLIFQFE